MSKPVVAEAPAVAPAPKAAPAAAVAPPQPAAQPSPPPAQSAANAAPSGGLSSEVLTAYASIDATAASLKARSEGAQAPAAAATAVAAPKLQETRAIDRDELNGIVKRGQALLTEGDIASARLLLRRAAEAGDPNAALLLAGSYDRSELEKLKVIGVAPDHAQAKYWYTKAVEYGSADAVRRLQQLAQRPD